MTRDNSKEYLPLVQALAEGKTIEACGPDGRWRAGLNFDFGLSVSSYRIKRDPRRWWLVWDGMGRPIAHLSPPDLPPGLCAVEVEEVL